MRLAVATPVSLTILLASVSALSAQQPAWWIQQKADCHISPSTTYSDWAAAGYPCNKSAPPAASAPTSTDPGVQAGQVIGKAIVTSVQQAIVERNRRLQLMAEERRRLDQNLADVEASNARSDAAQKQAAIDHLQHVLKFSDSDIPSASTVPPQAALPAASAKAQLLNSQSETTGQLFDNGRGMDDTTVNAALPHVGTPSAQSAPLDPSLANNKDYQAAATLLSQAQAQAVALNKQMADLQDQQKANPTPEHQIQIYNLSGPVSQANGAVTIAQNGLDSTKKKIIEGGPAIIVDDAPPATVPSTPPPDKQ